MATISEVKQGLDDIAQVIRTARFQLKQGKLQLAAVEAQLTALPTDYASVVTQINAYTPTGAYETLAKDELAKISTEFTALKAAATAGKNALAGITEF